MEVGWEGMWREWEEGREWELGLVCIMKRYSLFYFLKRKKEKEKKIDRYRHSLYFFSLPQVENISQAIKMC